MATRVPYLFLYLLSPGAGTGAQFLNDNFTAIANIIGTPTSANTANTIVKRSVGGLVSFTQVNVGAVGLTDLDGGTLLVNGDLTVGVSGGGNITAGEIVGGTILSQGTFIGDGSTITNINASSIASGTLANARTTAASANTASAIVARDGSGNFTAGTITATLSGNATTATTATALATGNQTIPGTLAATKRLTSGVVALTDGATINTDASLGNTFTVTLGGSRTMAAPSNATAGQRIVYQIKQGTGSQTITWTSGAGGFRFSGGTAPTLTTTAAKTDYLTFVYNAVDSRWDCAGERFNF